MENRTNPEEKEVSVQFICRNKTVWITQQLQDDGSMLTGIGNTKKESKNTMLSNYAEVSQPSFITKMGSVNSMFKTFPILAGGMTYIKESIPVDIFSCFLPVLAVNPNNNKEVALICEDVASKNFFFIHADKNTFVDSLETCIKQLYVEYFRKPEENIKAPKINSWTLTYLKHQKLESFERYVNN